MHIRALPLINKRRALSHVHVGMRRARLLLLILVVAIALPLLWRSMAATAPLRVDIGAWGDQAALFGANGREQSAAEDYRWTTAESQLVLPNVSSDLRLLRLHAHGWRPDGQPSPAVRLDVNGRAWGAFQTTPAMRTYAVLLPNETSLDYSLTFHTEPYQPPGDPRTIGVALDWAELGALGQPAVPALAQYAGQALLLMLLAALIWMLALPVAWSLVVLAACCAATVWANWQQPLWVGQAIGAWLLIVLLLIGATLFISPWMQRMLAPWMSARQARIAWALFMAALGVRLAGSVHPLFESHDIVTHTRWLQALMRGQLYMYSDPGEMRNRQIFNPPGGYVMLAPLTLVLPSIRLVIQSSVALLDAIGCLLLLPIARELRLSARAGLLALALAAVLPISMTMLWWGFTTNAMAQAMWVLLLWVLLRAVRRPTNAAVAVFSVAVAINFLMHAGALVILVVMMGLMVTVGPWRLPPRSRRALIGGVAVALLLLVPIYYTGAIGPVLHPPANTPAIASIDIGESLANAWADRYLRLDYTRRAWLLGFGLPLLSLLPVGLVQFVTAERRHTLQRALVGVWIGTCALFIAAYLSMATLARYVYFSIPLVCLAAGVALAKYRRWPAGRVVALAVVLLTAWIGLALWAGGVFMDVEPSVIPLSH
jgi:toxin CptA